MQTPDIGRFCREQTETVGPRIKHVDQYFALAAIESLETMLANATEIQLNRSLRG